MRSISKLQANSPYSTEFKGGNSQYGDDNNNNQELIQVQNGLRIQL